MVWYNTMYDTIHWPPAIQETGCHILKVTHVSNSIWLEKSQTTLSPRFCVNVSFAYSEELITCRYTNSGRSFENDLCELQRNRGCLLEQQWYSTYVVIAHVVVNSTAISIPQFKPCQSIFYECRPKHQMRLYLAYWIPNPLPLEWHRRDYILGSVENVIRPK